MLSSMYVTFIGFKLLKDLFEKDDKFCDIWFERKQIRKVAFCYKMSICSKVPDSVYPNVHYDKLSLRRGMKEVWVDTLV